MLSESICKLKDRFLHGEGLITTFLRSIVSSQAASWTDMIVRVVLFSLVFTHLDPFYRSNLSVACGAIVGGIVNCIINYHFTFHASGQNVKAVVVKYALVWIGNLILNSGGTEVLYILLKKWNVLEELGFKTAGYYSTARVVMSLLVSWFWNFILQRNFVYRPSKFDPYAVRFMTKLFSILGIKNKNNN